MKEILYLKIYKEIVDKIHNGTLVYGDKLPSKRKMAKIHNVSIITVENAYNQLVSEGYIYSKEKSGFYINVLEIEKKAVSIPEEELVEIKPDYIFNFINTYTGIESFPFSVWQKIGRNILTNDAEILLNKCPSNGLLELRQTIASYVNENLAMNVSSSQVIIGSGSENLYSLLINYFGREKKYAVEDPSYLNISKIYQLNDVNFDYIPLDDKGINMNILYQKEIDLVHVSTNHHYPTGITMPISRRYELLKWAKEKNAFIIEDDYDVELRLKGKLINPLFSLDDNNVIYLNTFSVTLNPSFRIAYMILPKRLVSSYIQKMSILNCAVPVYDQLVLSKFIQSGSYERHLNRKKKIYKDIRNIFLSEIKTAEIYEELTIKEADLGLQLLIKYPYNISDKIVEKIALENKIKIYTLSHFLHDKLDTKTLVVSYASFDPKNTEYGVNLLINLLNKIKNYASE